MDVDMESNVISFAQEAKDIYKSQQSMAEFVKNK
jgi:hypothetical protein